MATSFPPPPTSDKSIDWYQKGGIGFQVRTVNGHIESTLKFTDEDPNPKWSTPKWVKSPELKIHGMAPGLNYGQQCYEGLKAFRSPDDKAINLFRPRENAKRMQHSASFISIPAVPEEHFLKCVQLAVSLNAEYVPPHDTGFAMYIRPLLFGSSAQLGLSPPKEYTFVVFVLPVGVYHGVKPAAALILEDFDRAAPEGTGSAKVGGNYAPVLRFSERAYGDGYGITLHLDSRTRTEIDEFSTSAFIGVHAEGDKKTLVVPDSKDVIKSVTADSVCDIARSFGWKVEKRPIKYDELSSFDEVFAAGTAAALVPIKSIEMKSRSDVFKYLEDGAEPGPAFTKLITTLQGIQRGKVEDTFGWCEKVAEPKKGEYEDEEREGMDDSTKDVDGSMVDKLP